jgi:hypothetical protein
LTFVQDREQEPKIEGDLTRIMIEGLKEIFQTMKKGKNPETKIAISDFLSLTPPSFNGISVDPFQT